MSETPNSNATRKALQDFLRRKKRYAETADKRAPREDAKPDERSYSYEEDFDKLRRIFQKQRENPDFLNGEGFKPHNNVKNRFRDIVPFDHTRVKLEMINGMMGTDYINANYICGPQDLATYIAAQGPLPNTVKDFWRMIWEQKIKVILMACNELEGDPPKQRCERYWAMNSKEVMTFDSIVVTLEKDIDSGCQDYTIRYLRLERGREIQMCYQLQYTKWPDHGVPESVIPIIDMIGKARAYQSDDCAPILVHCSAGCGRTGTIIAIDIVWNLLKLGKLQNFNLFSIIKNIRDQRPSLIQSLDQYKFVYSVVAEIFERHLDMMNKHNYENVVFPQKKPEITPRKTPLSRTTSGNKPELPSKPGISVASVQPSKSSAITSTQTNISKETHNDSVNTNVKNVKALFESKSTTQEQAKPPLQLKSSLSPKSSTNTPEPQPAPRQKPPSAAHFHPAPDDLYSLAQKQESGSEEELLDEPVLECAYSENPTNAETYAYADPLDPNKWSLQHIALGRSITEDDCAYSEVGPESPATKDPPATRKRNVTPAYEDIDNPSSPVPVFRPPPPRKKEAAPAYEEVTLTGMDDITDDEDAPALPKRLSTDGHKSSSESIGKLNLNQGFSGKLSNVLHPKSAPKSPPHDGKVKDKTFKGIPLNFNIRNKKPGGPRGSSKV